MSDTTKTMYDRIASAPMPDIPRETLWEQWQDSARRYRQDVIRLQARNTALETALRRALACLRAAADYDFKAEIAAAEAALKGGENGSPES